MLVVLFGERKEKTRIETINSGFLVETCALDNKQTDTQKITTEKNSRQGPLAEQKVGGGVVYWKLY